MKKTLGLAVAEEVGIVRERMRAAILFLALDTKVCDAIQQDDIGLLTHTSVMLKQNPGFTGMQNIFDNNYTDDWW